MFYAVNYFAKSNNLTLHFSRTVISGVNKFCNINEACNQSGISGAGVWDIVTGHGLRGTVITRLFELGHAPTAVALLTGCKSRKSLESYKYL